MSAVDVPLALEAHEPPEVRGEGRDDVALLVARRHDLELVHARFRELPRFLSAGDLLVVNVSATLPAALETRLGGQPLQLWLSTPTLDGSGSSSCERATGGRSRDRPCLPDSTSPVASRPNSLHDSRAATDSPSPASNSASHSRTTSRATGSRSGTATCPSGGRSLPTRPSSPASPGARRCRAPAGPSRRSS